jgi:hypothetical protein
MLEFDQNILSKYPLKEAFLDFKNNRKIKERHVSFKDEM